MGRQMFDNDQTLVTEFHELILSTIHDTYPVVVCVIEQSRHVVGKEGVNRRIVFRTLVYDIQVVRYCGEQHGLVHLSKRTTYTVQCAEK